ncbi:hypothetical protein CEUSTIGMA_g12983.t1 [Chlamydomonas eustigma]|uniref:Mitochondrial carrier protein n=1 Tax=Chlamydomonas eustigma TaxID=1157962 RepID=A0A250XR81_9CHLO|nr:hypothetical protein CEUSTIGMA_g12983.t1 [Chlamydomonas eustigma]|eukprot:GAX85568.1 hypothetical protein CEUSTIGMA_g12983.t1 [Chlamydomonas eustigma]
MALWNGLPPALARGFIYGGLRLGMYSPIKTSLLTSLSTFAPPTPLPSTPLLSTAKSTAGPALSHQTVPSTASSSNPSHLSPSSAMTQGSVSSVVEASTVHTNETIAVHTNELSFVGKLAAGSLSGGVAAAISNPTELVKTRLQSKNNQHGGSLGVIRHIIGSEGIGGLWRGAVPGGVLELGV